MQSLYVLPVLQGFSRGTLASSHSPKICKFGVMLIGHYKLPVGVNVSVDGWLSLYISVMMNWQLVQGDPT